MPQIWGLRTHSMLNFMMNATGESPLVASASGGRGDGRRATVVREMGGCGGSGWVAASEGESGSPQLGASLDKAGMFEFLDARLKVDRRYPGSSLAHLFFNVSELLGRSGFEEMTGCHWLDLVQGQRSAKSSRGHVSTAQHRCSSSSFIYIFIL